MPKTPKAKQKPSVVPPHEPKDRPAIPARLSGVAGAPVTGKPDSAHPAWRLALLDLEHDESWSWRVDEAGLKKIVSFLTGMERLTWAEVKAQLAGSKGGSHKKHHAMQSGDLCREAQDRLREHQLEGFELFRFRLGNMERLWGIIYDGVFYPVWWDPDHKVYPTER